jgi:hypothetical protein
MKERVPANIKLTIMKIGKNTIGIIQVNIFFMNNQIQTQKNNEIDTIYVINPDIQDVILLSHPDIKSNIITI